MRIEWQVAVVVSSGAKASEALPWGRRCCWGTGGALVVHGYGLVT